MRMRRRRGKDEEEQEGGQRRRDEPPWGHSWSDLRLSVISICITIGPIVALCRVIAGP